uniref:Glycoprotein hormone-like secreted protein n=1 Tax=Tripedalia cystophora TaxID=6141 RepID=A0A481ZNE2_TRICY|nr:glycoprotein hormone-like secreted protein [Tripedalia cystophora]
MAPARTLWLLAFGFLAKEVFGRPELGRLTVDNSSNTTSKSKEHNLRWNGDCRIRRGLMQVYIPGCELKKIISNGCYGYCLSYARPDPQELSKRFTKMCSCCQPTELARMQVMLRCTNRKGKQVPRPMRLLVARKCACGPC